MPTEPIPFGPFLLRPDNGTLVRDGELVAIGRRGAEILGALLKSSGQVVTKADLMEAAWPGTAVEESNLSVQIASLRKLLGPTPDGGEWIVTVQRVGYRFVDGSQPIRPTQKDMVPSVAVIPSLAVLPFENLGGNPEQDYFADGVVDDIITALSRFKSFAVIARNSSFAYKGQAIDLRQIAKDLGVRYILEGSVRRAGDRLRISAQLVDGATGVHLWAERFDGALDDVFDFQDRITESVAWVVEPQIEKAEIERSRRERPGSIAAYDLSLRALAKMLSRARVDVTDAYALLMEALAIEPDNATVLGYAAWALMPGATFGWPSNGPDARQKCIELARRGLKHSGGDARVMAHCGIVMLQVAKEYDLGMAVLRSAVEANPNHLIVATAAAIGHLHCGKIEDALALLHRTIRLSPRDPRAFVPLIGIAHAQIVLGNYADALDWAARSLALSAEFDPTYWMLIAANAHLGRMDQARHYLTIFRDLSPGVTIASLRAAQPDKDASRLAAILDGLRLAGLEEG